MNPKQIRRWYKLILGMMFAVVAIMAIVAGLIHVTKAERQRAMVRDVIATGGNIAYRDRPENESWMISPFRQLLPRDYFDDVFNVTFSKIAFTDDDLGNFALRHHAEIGELESMFFIKVPITDEGLVHLQKFRQLKLIAIIETKVTDAGDADIQKALPSCQIRRREKD